eukprot:s204_g5.t1
MSISSELEHFMEFVFGFCAALDEAFVQEAPEGSAKAVLWQNVYFGAVPHDHPELMELTVYVLRQRLALEATSRNNFFAGRMAWADFPSRSAST